MGRIRYLGVVLYDVDRVLEAASVETTPTSTRRSAESVSGPRRSCEVITAARAEGISDEWIEPRSAPRCMR